MSLLISHHCFECGFKGYVTPSGKKIMCPSCETVNDWWIQGEEPPENHKESE